MYRRSCHCFLYTAKIIIFGGVLLCSSLETAAASLNDDQTSESKVPAVRDTSPSDIPIEKSYVKIRVTTKSAHVEPILGGSETSITKGSTKFETTTTTSLTFLRSETKAISNSATSAVAASSIVTPEEQRDTSVTDSSSVSFTATSTAQVTNTVTGVSSTSATSVTATQTSTTPSGISSTTPTVIASTATSTPSITITTTLPDVKSFTPTLDITVEEKSTTFSATTHARTAALPEKPSLASKAVPTFPQTPAIPEEVSPTSVNGETAATLLPSQSKTGLIQTQTADGEEEVTSFQELSDTTTEPKGEALETDDSKISSSVIILVAVVLLLAATAVVFAYRVRMMKKKVRRKRTKKFAKPEKSCYSIPGTASLSEIKRSKHEEKSSTEGTPSGSKDPKQDSKSKSAEVASSGSREKILQAIDVNVRPLTKEQERQQVKDFNVSIDKLAVGEKKREADAPPSLAAVLI